MLDRAAAWIESNVHTSPELATLGFAASIAAAGYVGWQALSGVASLVHKTAQSASMRAATKSAGPGFQILLARGEGWRGRGAGGFLEQSLENHLERFTFGAPFSIIPAGVLHGREDAERIEAARKRLERSGADMIAWALRESGRRDGLRIEGVSRAGGADPAKAAAFSLTFSGRRSTWTSPMAQALAYRMAKQLQPSLARPEHFRPEKVKDIARMLDQLLDSETELSDATRIELEDDFCAGALHVAEAGRDPVFVDKVVARRKARLADKDTRATAQTQAQLDLGRAMLAKAEAAFDPVLVRAAMEHLDGAIIKLRADPSIARAQQASDAITRGQRMLETRKRFSLNFAG